MSLPELKKYITQENINLYAEASKDFNPIHVDVEYAKKTRFGRTIAHGMLTLAYISQMMTAAFGKSWLTGGKLSVRFKAPAYPGDTLTISGKITKIEQTNSQRLIYCDLLCSNQHGEPLIIGEAKVEVRKQ